MNQRIVSAVPKVLVTPRIHIPLAHIYAKNLRLGYEVVKSKGRTLGLSIPEHAPSTFITLSNSLLKGQYIPPTKLESLQLRIHSSNKSEGKGENVFICLHDLDSIENGRIIPRCHWFGAVALDTEKEWTTVDVDVVGKGRPVLPVLSNPIHIHRILFTVWQEGVDSNSVITNMNSKEDSSKSEMSENQWEKWDLHTLQSKFRLSSFGVLTTKYDNGTGELYAKAGVHEPVYSSHNIRPSSKKRAGLKLPTRMDLKAEEVYGFEAAPEKEQIGNKYVTAVERIRERERIEVKKVGPFRYANA
jgi:hypothetical protein